MKRIVSIFFAFFVTIACVISGGVLLSVYDGLQLPLSSVSDDKSKEEDEEQISAQANTTLYTSSAYDRTPYTFSTSFIVGQKYILELSLTGSISNYGNGAIVIDSIKNDRDDVDWSDRKSSCEIGLGTLMTERSKVVSFIATSTEANSCNKLRLWFANNGASPDFSSATINIKVSKADPVYVHFDSTNIWHGYSNNTHLSGVNFTNHIDSDYFATDCTFFEVNGGGVYFAKQSLTVGQTYMWSVQVRSTRSHYVDIGQEQAGLIGGEITTNWKTFTHEFVANDNSVNAFIIYGGFEVGETLYVRGLTIQAKNSNSYTEALPTMVKWYGTYKTLPSLSKSGYTFDGWYTALNGGTKVTSSTSMTKTADHILYARWIKNISIPTRSSFYVYANGGTISLPRTFSINSVNFNNYGYGFAVNSAGWLESQNKGVHNSYSMMRISFYADVSNSTFTIRYISYGESNFDYAIFSNLDSTLADSYTADTSYFKRTYGESSPLEKTVTYTGISAGYHTIYIKYRKDGSTHSNDDSLKLFFEADFYSGSTSQTYRYHYYGMRYGTLPTATKTGNRFDGWWTSATGGTQVTETTIYNGNSIYAHWLPNSYEVAYNANGGTITQQAGRMFIESGYSASQTYTLEKGVVTPTLRSNYMPLSPGKTYVVSFNYWTDSGTQAFNIDFFPDTLPQYTALLADTTKRSYDWSVNLNHSDASNCQLRFFHDFGVTNSVHISNIEVYEATPGTAISTGYSESQVYSLETGVSVPTLRSNYLNLTNGATYRVSFCYWTDSGSQTFQIDFFPDTLPETSATADTTKRSFNWIVTLNHADASNCQLRFFRNPSVSNTVHITNIKLYALDTPFQGAVAYRNMAYGSPYASAPYSDNIPVATRQFYEFKGWYTLPSGGKKVESTDLFSRTTVSSRLTLDAQWAPVAITNHIYLRVISKDGNTVTESAAGGYIDLYRYVCQEPDSIAGNHTQTIASQEHVVHQGQEFRITANVNDGYVFAGFSTSGTPSSSIRNPSPNISRVATYHPTVGTNYYVYFKQVSDNQLKYDETDKYFYFEDGYYPQSEALEEMFTIEDYQKDWKGVETTYFAGQRYVLEVSLEGTILNTGSVAIVIDAVKKGNDAVDHNDRQTWCEVRLTRLVSEKYVRISFSATSDTVNNCDKLLLWYANNGTTNEDFSNGKIKVRVLKSLDKILERTATATGESISFYDGTANVNLPVYAYNGEKYVKVEKSGTNGWFKFEPIRWRISDYGVEKTELNIARYKTLLKFKDYTSFSDNFVAVSDLILGVGAMNNTVNVREGDCVADMIGFQNVENMMNDLTSDSLRVNYNRTGNVIYVDSYSGYGNGQTNAVNKQNTIVYSSPFRICSLSELEAVGFVNKQARASDMVAFILGLDKKQVSYWTRDLSNLGAGVAITPTGTEIRPWLDEVLGMRFAYTFKEGSAGGGRLDYESLNYIQSTGTQYIDTGWATTTGMICEYVADWQTPGYVVGSHDATEPYGRNGGWLSDELKWQLAYGGSCPNSTSANLNQKYKVKFSTVAGDVYLNVDDNRVDTYVGETQTTATSNVMILVNGWGLVHNDSGTYTKAKFYGAKIWSSDGVLVFDFEPVRNIYTGEIGLWDNVTEKFYGNAGTGNFIAG